MTLIISIFSFMISFFTLWKVYLDRGALKMTQPTTIFFGPDDENVSKIYLRTLLFSTSQKGQVIESMHVKLLGNNRVQHFNVWVHGERVEIVRGSGLYVGKEGVAHNHHFLIPKGAVGYEFTAGAYRLEVYASILNRKIPKKMFSVDLEVSESDGPQLKSGAYGLYFDWLPEARMYSSHLHRMPLDFRLLR